MAIRIEHIALWARDLEASRDFYTRYFGATAGIKYTNPAKQFSSYFLSFESGARFEIMHKPAVQQPVTQANAPVAGYAHLAFSVGSREGVDLLTERLRQDGFAVLDGPRTTGGGYYESVVRDPDGNPVEITI